MCLLCGQDEETKLKLGENLKSLSCHYLCVKFSEIEKSDSPPADEKLIKELIRVRHIKCVYCNKPGAAVNCNLKVNN